eukprot:gene223-303_t
MLSLALCLPVVNFLSIIALSWWSGGKADYCKIGKTLASNPIILSTLAGMLVSLSGITIPLPLMNTLDILGKAALALGLVCVGSGLVFSLQGLRPLALGWASLLKLVALPLVGAKVCVLFAVSAPVALAATFYCALPCAPNAYIMSKQLGGDARLMAALITLQTLLAAVTPGPRNGSSSSAKRSARKSISERVRSLAPALAAGTTAVIKMPGQTALTNALVARIMSEAPSLPRGVINLFTESGAEGAKLMVASPDVPVISFTGSTRTGQAISAVGAQQLKRFGLELGGKTPHLVFDDADHGESPRQFGQSRR